MHQRGQEHDGRVSPGDGNIGAVDGVGHLVQDLATISIDVNVLEAGGGLGGLPNDLDIGQGWVEVQINRGAGYDACVPAQVPGREARVSGGSTEGESSIDYVSGRMPYREEIRAC